MDKALKTMVDNMPEKTGRSLQEWSELLLAKNFAKHGEAVKYLKSEHGVTHGFANTIVSLSKEKPDSTIDLVENQYKGKENLLPIYKMLHKVITELGNDVTVSPKKATVSYIRKYQFALVKPATKSRIDIGLKLKGFDESGRLEGSGPFGAMCTHRIRVEALEELDQEVVGWLKEAYDRSI